MLRIKIVVIAALLFFLNSSISFAQTGGTPFVPPEVVELPGGRYLIMYSDGTSELADNSADLTARISRYTKSVTADIAAKMGSSGSTGISNTFTGLLSGFDNIDQELQGIIGSSVNDIMAGIQSQLTSLVTGALADLIDASPIGEVNSLKDLLKEVYGKQQKIEYQQYKVQYEEKKANTEINQSFANYYDKLDLYGLVTKVRFESRAINRVAAMPGFTTLERQNASIAASKGANVDDLVDDIKTACNINSGTVWMSTADRTKILDVCQKELLARLARLRSFKGQLASTYAGRNAEVIRNRQMSSFYNEGTSLNRVVGTTRKIL